MSTRPLFLATIFAWAILPQGFEIGAAEIVIPETANTVMHLRAPAAKQLPDRPLLALGTATRVARIDEAYRATNERSRIRAHAGATAKVGNAQPRPVTSPTATAMAMVNAAEPRTAAPKMKPLVDSQVATASYAAPLRPIATPVIETAHKSENPLRYTGPAGAPLRPATSGPSIQNTNNPLR